jgi:hypothetical protein
MAVPALTESFPSQSSSAPTVPESALEASRRLTELLTQAETECARDRLPDSLQDRIADILETTNHYAQASLETKRRALEKVDSKLRPTKPPRWKRDADLLAWLDSL